MRNVKSKEYPGDENNVLIVVVSFLGGMAVFFLNKTYINNSEELKTWRSQINSMFSTVFLVGGDDA